MDDFVFNYLLRDGSRNVDMLELLKIPSSRVLCARADGVVVEFDGLFALSADPGADAGFLPLLMEEAQKHPHCLILLHSAELYETLLSAGFSLVMECRHCIYESSAAIPYSLPENVEIRPLGEEFADFVHAHYRTVDDLDYIRERLSEGMLGVFSNGVCAGFIGTHDERSIGMLHILPAYRKRGLAFALEAAMVNRLLVQNRLPFCQVEAHNQASFALQRKLGFSISDSTIYWLEK